MTLGRLLGLSPKEVPIVLSEFGKPLLAPPYAGLHFNLTHSNGLALIALSVDGPVGIDLERKCRGAKLFDCESTFCHPQEIENLPGDSHLRAAQLLQIWTHKEAVLKALGTGLSHPPEQVRILFNSPVRQAISARPLFGINNQFFQTLSHPLLEGFQAAVSVPTATKSVSFTGGAGGRWGKGFWRIPMPPPSARSWE
jgi:4'-phosphopantetheinyl transferase